VSTPNNLPAQLSSFVGRERQLAELRKILRKSRLVTLTGPGGAGKTRLALRLAAEVLDRNRDGVWLVDLAMLSDARLLEQTVAAACGVHEKRRRSMLEVLVEHLRVQQTLLILDSCEHLVEPCASMVENLLRSCSRLTVLVTSREPLGVAGELIWRTPSLSLPSLTDGDHAELILESEAVRLYVDRAKLSQPAFDLAESGTAAAVARICTRLEGMPLAIELAAGLTRVMTTQEIVERLHDRFRVLTGGSRNALPRHQTLRQAVDWSYGLLSLAEKDLLARLSLFAGGFDLGAAEAVAQDRSFGPGGVLPVLSGLVDKSLVIAETRGPSRMRYRLLDTIREYAVEKLLPEDSADARYKHAMYFVDFCQKAEANLQHGEQPHWLGRVEEEEANIRLALTWCETEAPATLMLLAGYLTTYWYTRGKFKEGSAWLDKALDSKGDAPGARLAPLRARARLRRRLGDIEGARRDAQECVDLARPLGEISHLAAALTILGVLCSTAGDSSGAQRFYLEVVQISEKAGDRMRMAGALNNLALDDSARGNHEAANVRIDQALVEAQKTDDRISIATILESAGRIERRLGAHKTARRNYLEALAIAFEVEHVMNVADIFDGLALLALTDRDATRALVLAAAGSRQLAMSGSERSPSDEAEVKECLEEARAILGQPAADAAWRRGLALDLKDAVAYASGSIAERGLNDRFSLTPREIQVASLIAEGLTNPEIAVRLKMADRTADAHVEHIRNKLGLRTRSQIAVWTHERLGKA
jgi:predicted ATPase/DNA-binding CsgD family transcriptional regulator